MKLKRIIQSFGVAVTMAVAATSASALTVSDTSATINCSSDAATACLGFVGGSLELDRNRVVGGTEAGRSDTTADLYSVGNASEANQANALDFLLDGLDNDDFVTGDRTTPGEDDGEDDFFSFSSNAQFVAFKLGNSTAFVELFGSTPVSLTFSRNGAQGLGLSSVTEYGMRDMAAVPVPAAGLLLLGGLGGLAALRRRRKAA